MKIVRTMHVSKVEAEMRWAFKGGEAGEPYPEPQIISRTAVLLDAFENEIRIPITTTHLVGERFKVTIEPESEPDKEGTVGRIILLGAQGGGKLSTATLGVELLGKGNETVTLMQGDSLDLLAPATMIRISKV